MKEEVLDFFMNNSVSVSVAINGKTFHFLHFSPWIKVPDNIREDDEVEIIALGQLPDELKKAITALRENNFKVPHEYPLTQDEAKKDG